ncbi:C40 family peptidase [Allonocardiopsis opalescens]|uniref:NlpC/P60 family protein n=1 Tax=Allonocardiopsis opalescens TaxID=1144618 RepID=A0A2T0PVB5_9ACTN|nr:C40 family peptidase [Allonocardiopsis opalescens]PRX95472.1 NlpC/P60 family protein [Allonocardiopsis opalescens]
MREADRQARSLTGRRSAWVATFLVGAAAVAVLPQPAAADQREPVVAPAGQPAPAPGSAAEGTPAPNGTPSPSATEVAPLDETRSADLFVAAQRSLPSDVVAEIRELDGVDEVEQVDAARLRIDGEELSLLGVEPSAFRAYAPTEHAESDELWQGLAEGQIAVTEDFGAEHELEPGADAAVEGATTREVPLAEYAETGLAGIDAMVSAELSRQLGLPEGNALVISAPRGDAFALKEELAEILPEGAGVQVLPGGGGDVEVEEPGGGAEVRETDTADGLSSERIEIAIEAAESQLGTPYVWGGAAPGAFDCSGIVQWAYRQAGVMMPRVTHQQWETGVQVSYEDARRGDLIFWRHDPARPNYISHVALYLGEGMMLESPRTGDVVKIREVELGPNFAGIVRITPQV